MLMVIFGAGASFDSYAVYRGDHEWRPPLAVELFSKPRLYEIVEQYPDCQPIASRLATLPGGITVEEELESLTQEADEGDIERYRQLLAVRYYLQVGLYNLESRWRSYTKGVSNYKDLLGQIRSWKLKNEGPVCLVTFNYDTLLDQAVWQTAHVEPADSLNDYIATDYKLFKLHGSIDWGHEVDTAIPEVLQAVATGGTMATVNTLIRRVAELPLSDVYRVVRNEAPIWRYVDHTGRASPLIPAIAIPIQRKQEYECPEKHVEILRNFLLKVTHVVIIGWRGQEDRFVAMMVENMTKDVRSIVASRNGESAAQVKRYLEAKGYPGVIGVAPGNGFSDFALRRYLWDFLAWTGEGEPKFS